MAAGSRTSLKDMGRQAKALFTTARLGRALFLRLALLACAVKFVLYVLTQTVVPVGTPTHLRLTIDSDLLCLAVALFAMCRARDANMRGVYGLLGGLFSFYGVAILLAFAFKGAGIALTPVTVNVIAVVPQVTQLAFVWWMSRRPADPAPRPGAA